MKNEYIEFRGVKYEILDEAKFYNSLKEKEYSPEGEEILEAIYTGKEKGYVQYYVND